MGARRAQSVAELGHTRHLPRGGNGRPDAEAECDADGDGSPEPGIGEARQEVSMARGIRAQCLADGLSPAEIALAIHGRCEPTFGTTLIRAYRLALGIALADVVAQVRARYVTEGRMPPRFSETLLSSYESGQKRPGPEYLHYLCCVYQAEPADLGYPGQCLCGRTHRAPALMLAAPGSGQAQTAPAPPQAAPALPRAGPRRPVPGRPAPRRPGLAAEAGQPAGAAVPVRAAQPGRGRRRPGPAESAQADGRSRHRGRGAVLRRGRADPAAAGRRAARRPRCRSPCWTTGRRWRPGTAGST